MSKRKKENTENLIGLIVDAHKEFLKSGSSLKAGMRVLQEFQGLLQFYKKKKTPARLAHTNELVKATGQALRCHLSDEIVKAKEKLEAIEVLLPQLKKSVASGHYTSK